MEKSNKKRFFGNILFSFLGLTLLVMIISLIGNKLGLQATYVKVDSITGNIEKTIVSIVNLFSSNELRNIIGNAIANFVQFAPLGSFLMATIGIGMALKSGMLNVIFVGVGKHFNKFWMTYSVALLGIILSFAGDTGYVILIPLAAILYLSNNRNPIGGILTAFVAVTSGQGINFVLSNYEYGLTPYTKLAAKVTDSSFILGSYSNLIFCIIGTILLSFLITYITEKIVVPKLSKYKVNEEAIEPPVFGRREKRGLILASIGGGLILILFLYINIPGLPFSGLLLDDTGKTIMDKLYGQTSYFLSSITYLISIILLISGWLYGLGAKTLRSREEFSRTIYDSLNNIGSMLVLLFCASQLISIFKRSNIGVVIASSLIDLLKNLNFTSIPLILLVFVFILLSNVFLTSSVAKWSIASPIVVPSFMGSNMTAQFAQVVFRVSESASNIMTPLSAYFIMFVGYLEMYNKGEKRISFSNCYKLLWPYAVGIMLLWIIVIITWYIVGLPIGLGVNPTI